MNILKAEKYKGIFFFLIVLIVATFFRLYNLPSVPPGLYPDEAMNGNNALEAISTGEYKIFYPENNGREGLFINIQAFLLKLSGIREPWVLRLASALFGILTVIGVFLLIRQLYRIAQKDRHMGLIAAFSGSFFMAIGFWHVNFSRIGFRAIMAPAFIVWSTYVLLKAFEKTDREASPKKGWLLVFLSGLLFGLGMHSYIAYRATPLFILALFVLYGIWYSVSFKKMFARLAVFVLGALISTAPLIMFFVQNPADFFGRTSQISVFSSDSPILNLVENVGKSLLMFFAYGDYNWRHNYAGQGLLHPLVAFYFLVGIVFGIVSSIRFFRKKSDEDRGESFIFLIASFLFVIALLPTIISNEGIPHALRAIIMIPAVFVLAGVGATHIRAYLLKKVSPRLVLTFGILFFAALSVHSFYTYFIDWGTKQEVRDSFAENYVTLGKQILCYGDSVHKYIVVDAGGVAVRGYPMSTQTVMFITDTFTPDKQKAKNIYYITPEQEKTLQQLNVPDSYIFHLN